MKILVICQYYEPEPFRIGDICEGLVARGHEVQVITGIPNYPMGKIYPGYERGARRDEEINGVRIHRCYTIERRSGVVFRFLNYYSYAISSSMYVKNLSSDFDVVFVNQLSPVMMVCAGITYKKKYGKKMLLYCLDLWPESLISGGIKRGSLVFKVFWIISKRIYKKADRILVTSKLFSDYFRSEFGIEEVKYLPQYAEEVFNPNDCLKIQNKTIDLMFAGNIGTIQNLDTIVEAAKLTADISNLHWHIVGDGSDYERIKRLSIGINTIHFYGRVPLSEMPKYYAIADAMLVTLKKEPVISRTLPGKVQTYMAAGKPIIGAIDGEASRIIKESDCGLCGPAEDPVALAENVRSFLNADRSKMGVNARLYYMNNFDKEKFMGKLITSFEKVNSFEINAKK